MFQRPVWSPLPFSCPDVPARLLAFWIPSINTPLAQPVLVTGASGFIGTHLVRRLADRRDQVFCLVRSAGAADATRFVGSQVIKGDILARSDVDRALAESNAATVFHLAGLVRSPQRHEFECVNAGGAEIMAAACAARPAPPALVIVSSLAAAGLSTADYLRTELDLPAPVSHYGRSKLAGELAAARFAGSVPLTLVRPPIVYGPGDRALLEVIRPIAQWGLHVVPGRCGGDRRVSLVYVDDFIEGLLLAAASGERVSHCGPPGQGVYFMSGHDSPTYADLGRAIAIALGRKPPTIIGVPGPLLQLLGVAGDGVSRVRRRAGWMSSDKMTEALAPGSWTCASAKAHERLGWTPAAAGSLVDRLRVTIEWYRHSGWL